MIPFFIHVGLNSNHPKTIAEHPFIVDSIASKILNSVWNILNILPVNVKTDGAYAISKCQITLFFCIL